MGQKFIGWYCHICGELIRTKERHGKLQECRCKPCRYDAHQYDKYRETDTWIKRCQCNWTKVYAERLPKNTPKMDWSPWTLPDA